MAKASDNPYPSILVVEGAAPTSPAAGNQRLYVDTADHKLKRVNSTGTVTTVEGGSSTATLCQASVSATATTFTAATWTKVIFDVTDIDTAGTMHSTTTNNTRITVPTTGKYLLAAKIQYYNCTTTSQVQAAFVKNGAVITTAANQLACMADQASGVAKTLLVSTYMTLTATDYIETIIYLTNPTGLPEYLGNANNPQMTTFSAQLVGT